MQGYRREQIKGLGHICAAQVLELAGVLLLQREVPEHVNLHAAQVAPPHVTVLASCAL